VWIICGEIAGLRRAKTYPHFIHRIRGVQTIALEQAETGFKLLNNKEKVKVINRNGYP
jgi:hypothetical protein